jgi:cyclopropane fatty-acyl-phospholipid synthase-like methyltransferase
VLQHMKPKYSKRYIKEFLRILLPNGLLIFQIPGERRHSENPARKMIRHIIPSSILDWIFYLRIGFQTIFKREPKMEMYSIRKEEIAQLIQKNKGKIVDIKQDLSDHSVWISLKYYVTK